MTRWDTWIAKRRFWHVMPLGYPISSNLPSQYAINQGRLTGLLMRWVVTIHLWRKCILEFWDLLHSLTCILHILSLVVFFVKQNVATGDYTIHEGFLFKGICLCVPECSLGLQIIRELHDEGHVGRDQTLQLVSSSYFLSTLPRDVERYVECCHICQQGKGRASNSGLYLPLPIPTQPWTNVSMGFILGFPRTQRGHDFFCRR